MKYLLVIVLFLAQNAFAAPTTATKTNDMEMEEIQNELMQEMDTVTIDGEDEDFLDQEIEAMPEVEEKLELLGKKQPSKKMEIKQALKTSAQEPKKK